MPDLIASLVNSKIESPSPSRNARARLQRHAKELSHQKICLHVPVNNDEQNQQLNIPRARLTREFVQGLIRDDSGSGEKHVAQYLASNDKDGAIVQLDRMQTDCRPLPASYTVVTKSENMPTSSNQNDGTSLSPSIVVYNDDGQCKVYTKNGTYSGQINENGEPSGLGKMEYRDGDVITGSFATANIQSPNGGGNNDATAEVIDFEANPYDSKGMPHGPVNISFADGSIYEGEMKNGNITGHGIYVNAIGDQYEGSFELGLLVEGKIKYASGEVAEGIFRGGENLDGFGKWWDSVREISGYFEDGLLTGKATVVYKEEGGAVLGTFRGFFHEGRRHLHGVLASDGTAIEGPWMGDMLLAGGRTCNTVTGKSLPTHDEMTLPENISTCIHLDEDFARSRVTAIEEDSALRMNIKEKNCKAFDKAFRKRLSRRNREESGQMSSANSATEKPRYYFAHERRQIRPKTIAEAISSPGLRWDCINRQNTGNSRSR